ncbi:hypothetical protein CPB86DRAFT_829849 [Serendipita vermifera]|nr:hypothetical protein CPB86DRAFT_829849 [Serendipita vermifera]
MSVLVLKNTTVELSPRGDASLKRITNLVLEVSDDGRVIDKANLLSQEPSPRMWEADQVLIIPEAVSHFMICAVTEGGRNERQKIAFMELNSIELRNVTGKQYEVPLISNESCPNVVLKTSTIVIENVQELLARSAPNNGQGGELSHQEATIGRLFADADTARQDFQCHGGLERLEQAICQYRAAVELIPEDDPRRPDLLNHFGISLRSRFNELGCLDDIDESIEQQQIAVHITSDDNPDKSMYLTNLGNALIRRFERLGNLADLDNAILQQQAAVRLTSDESPQKAGQLNNLGTCIQIRFERVGNPEDIEESIVQKQRAVGLTPDGDPDKPMYLLNLGNSFQARFEVSGNIADIDSAVAQMELAVNLTSDDHPSKSRYLSSLGSCLEERFERLECLADLDNAIIYQQQSVNLTPDSHPDKPGLLINLGVSLDARFKHLGSDADLNDSILQYQTAVNLMPEEHSKKAGWLNNLGTSLCGRFNRFGNIDDLHNAIARIQMAVNLTPEDHPNRTHRLANLGASLAIRFEKLGNLTDLDNAIKYEERALNLTPMNHPNRASRLFNLFLSFKRRFHRLHNHCDAEAAISHLYAAAASPDGPPTMRFQAASSWIKLASETNHDTLLAAYGCALDLLPLVAWLGLPIADRHRHLVKIGGIARDAAAAAISAKKYDKALEWLEQGRSIVWTQILQLRTPVDQLRKLDPDLADRLSQVSQLLDRESQQTSFFNGGSSSAEEEGRQYRKVTAEWESIIKLVRSLPSFDKFLRPLSSSQLKNAALNGPVVVLNIAEGRCDALALSSGLEGVIHIPLPNITSERVTELRDELKNQLYSSGIRMRYTRAAKRVTDKADMETCKRILAELWTNLVKPVLDSLAFSPHPDVLPRMWWCATGPLAFLPIHAAGIYGSDSNDSRLSNYVISSYIPTVSTLLDLVKPTAISPFNLLSVIQSSAPGASAIPSTKKELEYIRQRLSGRGHVVLEGPAGTKKRVMDGMENCNWLHLACHGTQRADEPTKSALLLDDGHLTLEEIIKLDLPHAEFAFLSACQTTTGDESLSEEAVHIAGGMLLAGYRSVVATMWSIQDELAPMVTDEFYRHIMSEGASPDPRKAAEALHMSMEKLRQQPGVQLTDWIPFVHLGV